MDSFDFDHFCHYEHWQHQGTPASHAHKNPAFELWQCWLFRKPLTPIELSFFPPAAVAVHQGWLSYHLGRYSAALADFIKCLSNEQTNWPAINLDAALGICRLYTRTGQWFHARGWGLYALHLARKHNRLFDISRCFNVLGDLYCRAGHTQLAHLFLMSSVNVLPQGSVHKARHYNSLATVLMRQKATLRAEALLMNSLYLAYDNQDTDSIWHALARLQWLYIQSAIDIKVTERFIDLVPSQSNAIAKSYIELAQAIMALQHAPAEAQTLLLSAATRASDNFPVESAWFSRCAGKTPHDIATVLNLPKYPAPVPQTHASFDKSWQDIPLADEQLNWLNSPSTPLLAEQLFTERQYFFI